MEFQKIKGQIETFVKENGFRTGYRYNYESHLVGLPGEPYVMVKPDYSPADASGNAAVIVFANRVQMWTLATPLNHNRWHPHGEAIPYVTKEDLLAALEKTCRIPASPLWG